MENPRDAQREFYGEGRGPPILVNDPKHASHRRRPCKRRKGSTPSKMTAEQLLVFARKHNKSTPSPSKLPGDFPQEYAYRALAAYSLLRTLSVQLRLSPFTPNVFLRALYLPYPNKLLGDVHVGLLRILLPNLNLGYSYKAKGALISYNKRRAIDNIRLPLRAGDNLTFLDGLSWPLFYDDYCHLSADQLWAALNDERNHLDFRYLGLQSLGISDYHDKQFAGENQYNSWAQGCYPPHTMHYPIHASTVSSGAQEQHSHDDSDSDYDSDPDDAKDILGPSKVMDLEDPSSPANGPKSLLRNDFLSDRGKSIEMDGTASTMPSQPVLGAKRTSMETSGSQRPAQARADMQRPESKVRMEESMVSQAPRSRGRLLPLHRQTSGRKRPLSSDEQAPQITSTVARGMDPGADVMPGAIYGRAPPSHFQLGGFRVRGDNALEKPLRVDDTVKVNLRKFVLGATAAPSDARTLGESEAGDPKAEYELSSESSFEGKNHWSHFELLIALRSGTPYHRLSIARKLDILEYLIDELLNVGAIAAEFSKRQAVGEYSPFSYGVLPSKSEFDNLMNEDDCGICGLEGDLLCCDGCIWSFHKGCIGMSPTENLPEGKWLCPECKVVDPSNFGPLHGGRKASVDWFHAGELASVLRVHEETTAGQQVQISSSASNQLTAIGAPLQMILNAATLPNSVPITNVDSSIQSSQSLQPSQGHSELPISEVVAKVPIAIPPPSASGSLVLTSTGANGRTPVGSGNANPKPVPMPGVLPPIEAVSSQGSSSVCKVSNSLPTLAVVHIDPERKMASAVQPQPEESQSSLKNNGAATAAGNAIKGIPEAPPPPPCANFEPILADRMPNNSGVIANVDGTLAAPVMPIPRRTALLKSDKEVSLGEYEFLIVHGFVFCRKCSTSSCNPYHVLTNAQIDSLLKGLEPSIRKAWPFAQIPAGESYYGNNFPPAKYYFAAFESFNPSYYINKYRKAPVLISVKAVGGAEVPSLMLASYENECNAFTTHKISEAMLRDMTFDKLVADCIKSERTLFDPYALIAGYMLKLDATLRRSCLLNELWESGKTKAIHQVWACNVGKCKSVQKLSRLLRMLVDQIHPRAFLEGWFHNSQLKRAETQEASERHYSPLPQNWNPTKESRKRLWERTPSTMLLSLCAKEKCELEYFVRGIRPDSGIQATAVRSKRKKARIGLSRSTGELKENQGRSGDGAAASIVVQNVEQPAETAPEELEPAFVDVSEVERPQKPYPAYFQFANNRRLVIKEQNPHASSTDISKILSTMWKSASEEFREEFSKEEMKQREAYKVAMEEYHKKIKEKYIAMGVAYPRKQLGGKIEPQTFENLGIDASDENIDNQSRGFIRRSRRSGRIARNSFDTDIQTSGASSIVGTSSVKYSAPSDDLEFQIEKCKRKHIKPIEKLVKSATQREKFWPLAGRVPFATTGDLPALEMKRLGRNAGGTKAPHVAYNTSHEVGQVCWAHLWRKRTDDCSTFEDLIYQARVLESFLDRQVRL